MQVHPIEEKTFLTSLFAPSTALITNKKTKQFTGIESRHNKLRRIPIGVQTVIQKCDISLILSIILNLGGGTSICRDMGMCHYFGYFFRVFPDFWVSFWVSFWLIPGFLGINFCEICFHLE